MKFQRKVLIYIALLFTLTLAVTSGLTTAIFNVHDAQIQLNTNFYRQMILAERAQSLLNEQFSLIPSFVMNKEISEVRRFRNTHSRFRETLEQLQHELNDKAEIAELDQLLRLDEVTNVLAERGIQIRLSGAGLSEVNDYFKNNTYVKTALLQTGLAHLLDVKTAELSLARKRVEHSENRTMLIMIFTAVTVVLLFLMIANLLWRAVCTQSREIALREKLLAQQESLAIARKEVVEVVSHDLKSPLATLFMNLQMTKEDIESGDLAQKDILESISMALRSTKTMNDLVMQLLDHSKIESGGFIGETHAIDANEVIDQHLLQIRLLARERNVTIDAKLDRHLPPVLFDETRFLQVIANLTSNALKFVNHGGGIVIRSRLVDGRSDRPTEKHVEISIRNTGAALQAEELEHIFERYWQVRKTAKKGSGLGLAIVKGTMEAYGGSVKAENSSLGGVEMTLIFKNLQMENSNLKLFASRLDPEASVQLGQQPGPQSGPQSNLDH